jgi:hypothetical protein
MFIVLLCLSIAICGIIVIKFMNKFNEQIQLRGDAPQIAKDTSNVISSRLPKWLDSAFIFVYILLVILAFFLAMMVESNPAFLVITFIYMFFLVIISKIVGSIWARLILDPNLASEAATLPIINYMIPRLTIFSFVISVGILIIMVSKRQG